MFTVFVKAENVTGVGGGGKPLMVLRWRDAADRTLTREMYDWAPYGTYDFRPRVLHLQAPEGAARWDCLTGTTWWDDASFSPRVVPGRGALLATFEAENASRREGGKVADDLPGFTGTGFFEPTATASVVEWDTVAGGGDRVIAVRYSWEGAAKSLELFVNGVSQGRKTPVCTGRRGSYATGNWPARLRAGRNSVRLSIRTQGPARQICPTIDRLEVYAASASAAP